MPATLGKSNNYPRSVMQRLGAQPARSVIEPVGGQGPQKLVTEFGTAIANGEAEVVMIIGSEPGSTRTLLRRARRQARLHRAHRRSARGSRPPDRPVHQRIHRQARSDRRAGAVRVAGQRAPWPARAERRRLPPGRWPSCSRRSRKSLPRTRFRHRRSSGRSTRSITVTDDNRMICDPYPRLMVARDQVNQGAAAW